MKTTLYKKSTTGKTQEWTIELDNDKYRTISGYVDGAKTTTEWTECYGKNIGRANETSPSQQAELEVASTIQKKKDKGYCEEIENAGRAKHFEPMLAKEYEVGKINFPVYSQPKLDGIRCIVTKDGMFSRNGKPLPNAPHIYKQLEGFCKEWRIHFDGELYNHEFKENFNKICSLAKITKPNPDTLAESERLLQYHIYDCYPIDTPDMKFIDRYEILNNVFDSLIDCQFIEQVNTLEAKNKHDLDMFYEIHVRVGYEGQMIRYNTPYENKRSKNLLKRKEFQDSEFEILDIVEGEGNRSGMAGYMVFETDNQQRFKSNIKGDWDYLRGLLENREFYIGQTATIKYFNLTPDGIPRFPFVIAIRDYE